MALAHGFAGRSRVEPVPDQDHTLSRPSPRDNREPRGFGPLLYVHGYDRVNRIGAIPVDGPRLECRFDFRRTRRIAKITTLTLDFSTTTHVLGLGYSFVEIREHSVRMDMRMWVLATPIDGTLIDLSLVSQMREVRNPMRWMVGLGFLPLRLRAPIMNKIMLPCKPGMFSRTWSSGVARGTGPGRSFAFPTAKSCPIEPIALSSIPILVIRRVHSREHQTALHMTTPVRGLEEKLQDGVHRGLAESQ